MYGKQFVAALLFLAVAQVSAQEYGDEYGTEAAAAYEATPEPDVEFDDAAAEVTIPDGDWKVSYIAFEAFELADDDAIWDWANGLPDDLADYEPSGLVLVGTADIEVADGDSVVLAIQAADSDMGIAAVYGDGEFATYSWDYATDGADGELDAEPEFIADPEDLTAQDGLEDSAGIGYAFGQSYDAGTWNIWLYNVASDDWADNGTTEHDFMWLQYDGETEVISAFTETIDIVLSGATSLLATATCMTAIAVTI